MVAAALLLDMVECTKTIASFPLEGVIMPGPRSAKVRGR